MRQQSITTTAVLNRAGDLVRATASPQAVVLFLAALPFRLLQADFVERLLTVGADAPSYGNALQVAALWTMTAFILLAVARLHYARACRFALLQVAAPRSSWQERIRVWLPGVTLALLFQLTSITLIFTLVAVPLIATLATISIVTTERSSVPRLRTVLRQLMRYSREGGVIAGMLFVFLCALGVTVINLFYAFQLLLWLMGGIPLFDTVLWRALLQPGTRIFSLAIVAGALAVLEPFWLAAHSVYVHGIEAQQGGDDLRSWYASLQQETRSTARSAEA